MKEEVNNIQKPVDVASSNAMEDFVVHVMPKEFYGVHADAPKGVKEVQKESKPPVAPAPVAPVPPPPVVLPTPKPTPIVKKPSRTPMVVLMVGILLLAVIAGGAYYYVSTLPSPEEPEVVVPEPEPETPEPEVVLPQPGIDTDTDGLTDIEERLYGTDFRNPDTDADSFLDGNEVFHRFDPLGFAPSTLLDTGSVAVYEYRNGTSFNLHYPITWEANALEDADQNRQVRFDAPDGSTIVVTRRVYEGDPPWLGETPGVTKEGYDAYTDQDGRHVIVADQEVGFIGYDFFYDLKTASSIEYLQTFKMMVNSFRIP